MACEETHRLVTKKCSQAVDKLREIEMIHEYQLTRPVLQVLSETLLGELTTTELREELKRRLKLDASDLHPMRNRGDRRIDQIIRNIKSHKEQAANPFCEGYLEDVPRGFRITEKGRRYLDIMAKKSRP